MSSSIQLNRHTRLKITVPSDISTATSMTADISTLVDEGELDNGHLTARVMQITTAAGVIVDPAGSKAALSGDTLTITEATAGFTSGDVYLIELEFGQPYPAKTATKV